MKKYLFIVLLVGDSLCRAEADSSKTHFYQMGIDAARENFKPKYSFALGAAMPNPIIYVAFNLISPVKVEDRYNPILNAKNGKSFKRGYVIETKKLRSLYASTKWGLKGFSGCIKKEYEKINILDVYPSNIKTNSKIVHGMEITDVVESIYSTYYKNINELILDGRK